MRNKIAVLVTLAAIFSFFVVGCSKKREETSPQGTTPLSQVGTQGTAYQSVPVQNGGIVSGKVVFKGKWTPATIPVTKDQEVCGKSKKDPSLLVSESGEVQNAVVYIADIDKGKKMEPQEVTLTKKIVSIIPMYWLSRRARRWRSKTWMGSFTIFIVTAKEMTRSIWRSRSLRKRSP